MQAEKQKPDQQGKEVEQNKTWNDTRGNVHVEGLNNKVVETNQNACFVQN